MKHIGLIVFCAASLAMQNLAAITATKEYVDRRIGEIGSGAGGPNTVVLTNGVLTTKDGVSIGAAEVGARGMKDLKLDNLGEWEFEYYGDEEMKVVSFEIMYFKSVKEYRWVAYFDTWSQVSRDVFGSLYDAGQAQEVEFEGFTAYRKKSMDVDRLAKLSDIPAGGSSIEVDKTLSKEGAAADAKKVGDWFNGVANDFRTIQSVAASAESKANNAETKADSVSIWAKNHDQEYISVNSKANVAFSLANEAKTSAVDALAYATGVFNYMNANTNAWFSGTNYVVGVAAAARHKFAFEPGMDLASVPCSMALMELRDGVKQVVWDQRDWVSWYWSFKSAQMNDEIRATNALIRAEIASRAPAAWAQRTAATGLVNPDATTTWIDTQKIVLSPGMAWETVAEVEGCAYWTITGNATIGGDAAADGAGILTIKDFEGKPVMTIKKTESKLVYLERGDFVADSVRDAQGRVTFTMRSDVQPVGEYSTVLDLTTFVEETDEANPANYEWENLGDNRWRIHYLLKPTISASQCFARFKVQKQGSTTVEYGAAPTIKDGLIYNGVKIAPVIPSNVAVGDTITWKVLSK